MKLTVRAATTAELPELMQLYTNARDFMQTHGNPTQWHAGYPGEARLAAEIERGVCHVVMGEETIQAVFCLIPGDDPTYHHIEDGAWPEALPVRADTHADNTYMQHTLEACGFVRCGTIYTEDGTPRWAYYHYAI